MDCTSYCAKAVLMYFLYICTADSHIDNYYPPTRKYDDTDKWQWMIFNFLCCVGGAKYYIVYYGIGLCFECTLLLGSVSNLL